MAWRTAFLVDISAFDSMALAQSALDAAILAAKQPIPDGTIYFPEQVAFEACALAGAQAGVLSFTQSAGNFGDWANVAHVATALVNLDDYPDATSAEAAITALVVHWADALQGSLKLRSQTYARSSIAGRTVDLVVLLFSDGHPYFGL